MKLEVFGPGCPKCKKLFENARKALEEEGGEHEVEKVSDLKRIMEKGVVITPALCVDGEVRSTGKVLSVQQIKDLLGSA